MSGQHSRFEHPHRFCVFLCLACAILTGAAGCVRSARRPAANAPDASAPAAAATLMRSDSTRTLAAMDLWVLCPPREVIAGSGPGFDLDRCRGVRAVGKAAPEWAARVQSLAPRLGVKQAADGDIRVTGLEGDHPQGSYTLKIDRRGIELAATDAAALDWGMTTLVQLARCRRALPSLTIHDAPALTYRGMQLDISRGQVPTPATFARMVDILSEAKMNVFEFYIEHVYRFPSHPEIAPPDAVTPEEARALFDYAAARSIDAHALFQTLGHADHILNLPQYAKFNIGPCAPNVACTPTFDIRNPEAVAFVRELVGDMCKALPGRYLSIDITEINYEALIEKGLTQAQVTDLIFDYVLKINETVKANGMRLMVIQGPLDSTGHLAGMGPKMAQWPPEIMIGSYYCAGGCYQPAWEQDFPRFKQYGVPFFAQPWIYSHSMVFPWTGAAADFSELEVSRGLQYGAIGSITADWGDMGHYHLPGQTWYPALYHGAVAWAGGAIDRAYFDQAFTRQLYGIRGDAVARAVNLLGNVGAIGYRQIAKDGKVVERVTDVFANRLLWSLDYLFVDPFTNADFQSFAEPEVVGRQVLAVAEQARTLLDAARTTATMNRDNLEQLLLAAQGYRALANKLIAMGHVRDGAYPRAQAAAELEALAEEYAALRAEFMRLWLTEARENANFHRLAGRFEETIAPCRAMAATLRAPR